MAAASFTGKLRKHGSTGGTIDVEFVLDGAMLKVRFEDDELGSWPADDVDLLGARLLVRFGTEDWWFEPDDPSGFIDGVVGLGDPRGGGMTGARRRFGLFRVMRKAWRGFQSWRRVASYAEVAVSVGGVALIGLAGLLGTWYLAMSAVVGTFVVVRAYSRAEYRAYRETVRDPRFDIRPRSGGVTAVVSPRTRVSESSVDR